MLPDRIARLLDHANLRRLTRLHLLRAKGSYQDAGKVLDISAGGISHSIHELGRAIGVPLVEPFCGGGRGVAAVAPESQHPEQP